MQERIILCNHCQRRLNKGEEIVTAAGVLQVLVFHDRCYANVLKQSKSLIISNNPINSVLSNIMTMISLILALIAFITPAVSPLLGALLLLPIILRLYSYFVYERALQ